MSGGDIWLLVAAAILVVIAGVFSGADAALSSFSRVRAEEMAAEGRAGARRLLVIVKDPARFLNTALFLRMLSEIAAIVAVASVLFDAIAPGSVSLTTSGAGTGPGGTTMGLQFRPVTITVQ